MLPGAHDLEAVFPWCLNERLFKGELISGEVGSPNDARRHSAINTLVEKGDGTGAKQTAIRDITQNKLAEDHLGLKRFTLNHPKGFLARDDSRLLEANRESLAKLG